MRFDITNDPNGMIRFSGEITMQDLVRLNLDRFDLLQINEPPEHASDILLDLELIFRRLERQESGR